jgi:hypothetical protein
MSSNGSQQSVKQMDPLQKRLLLKSYVQNPKVWGFRWAFPLAHAAPLLQIYTSLADQLTRGFQSADDQFQALQTQVTEGFQSKDFRL